MPDVLVDLRLINELEASLRVAKTAYEQALAHIAEQEEKIKMLEMENEALNGRVQGFVDIRKILVPLYRAGQK